MGNFLLAGIFYEYRRAVEAHFRSTDQRIEAHEKSRTRETELLQEAVKEARRTVDIRLEAITSFDTKYELIDARIRSLENDRNRALAVAAFVILVCGLIVKFFK